MTQRNVDIVIKAKDETQRAINSARTAMERFAAAQAKTARYRGLVDAQKQTAAAAADAAKNLRAAGLAASGAQVQGFRAATAAARKANVELERYRQNLKGAGSNAGSFSQLGSTSALGATAKELALAVRAATAIRNQEAAVQELAAAEAHLGAVQRNASSSAEELVLAHRRVAAAQDAQAASTKALDAVERSAAKSGLASNIVGAYSSRKGRGPLGLRPYEVQNLGYQVNDLITQVSSGTPVSQAVAQQAGQIIQLFPKATSVLLRFTPALAAVVTVLLALKRLGDIAETQKTFAAQMAASADASEYNASALAATTQQLDAYRGSLEQARSVLKTFMAEHVAEDRLRAFGMAAADLARLNKEDVTESAQSIAKAFTGSMEAVRDLDERLNFLTASELEQVDALFKAGRAEEARALAFEKARAKFAAGAAQMRGPWSDAVDHFARSWDRLLDGLANSSVIQATVRELTFLADRLDRVTALLPGAQAALGGNGPGLPGGVQRRPDYIADPGLTGWRQQLLGSLTFTQPSWLGGAATNNARGRVVLTPDIIALVRTLATEARNNAQAQQDVAAVILNRSRATGQSPLQVVTAPGQFQGVGEPGSRQRQTWASLDEDSRRFQEILANVLPLLEGRMPDPTGGATLYYSPTGQVDNVRRGLSRNLVPDWADPAKMTLERHGHRFFTGAINGASSASGPTEDQQKAYAAILTALQEQRTTTLDITDAERIRLAGAKALQEAQAANVTDQQAAAAKAYAEDTERLRIAQEHNKVQTQFRKDLAEIIADREFELSLVGKTNREIAVARAVREAEALATRAQTQLTAQQRAEIVRSAEAAYDAEEAERLRVATARAALELAQARGEVETRDAYITRRLTEDNVDANNTLADSYRAILGHLYDIEAVQRSREQIEKRVADLANLQQSTMQALDTARQQGDGTAVAALTEELRRVNIAYREALVAGMAFWQAKKLDDPAVQGAIQAIQAIIATIDAFGIKSVTTAAEINQVLVGTMMNGWSTFWNEIEDGSDALDAARASFLAFASDFLRKMAEMIFQAQVLRSLNLDAQGVSVSGNGGTGALIAGFINGLFRHDGGMIGSGGGRPVPLAAFAGATRYHSGGVIGLKPNERPVIAEIGEEMLTEDDPRHRNNLGRGGRDVKIVNVFDPADALEGALGSDAGERVMLNFVQRNAVAFKAALG